ncbi:MAG: transposase [Bdellovibrionales bacterium]
MALAYPTWMPRKKLIYTHEFPYHVSARSNNKEWFYLPKEKVWEIFITELNYISVKYKVLIHAFVLMDNHYHLLLTTYPNCDLGKVLCELQKSVSRKINFYAGRINHVFGGPTKPSLIVTPESYQRVLKYIYRNPVTANLTTHVEHYKYSSLNSDRFGLSSPIGSIARMVPQEGLNEWLNQAESPDDYEATKHGLKRTTFKPRILRKY